MKKITNYYKEAHGDILLTPSDNMNFRTFIYATSEKYKNLISHGVHIHFKWHNKIYYLNNKTYEQLRRELRLDFDDNCFSLR